MNVADYHTHTPFCQHAEGEAEEYVKRALEKGLVEYGISDHAPVVPEPFDDWRMLSTQLPEYFQWVERARAAAGALPIRMGLECDWFPGCLEWINTLWEKGTWDYFIGSVHYLSDQWDFDNPKWLGKWAEIEVEEVWGRYWKTYLEMVQSGVFHIHGHPDLIKKFGFKPEGDLRRFYDPVVQALVDADGCIELNTAGWHKPCAEQYPSELFLELCAQAGVALVISSDAHSPMEVGRDFPEAIALAQACGFTETALFHRGERSSLPLAHPSKP